MGNTIHGSCLCGDVTYEVEKKFDQFYFCHCSQCKKITGSAYASNLFVKEEYLNWLTGYDKISIYKVPDRDFTKAFCNKCGSGLPFTTSDNKRYIVPAGSLSEEPKSAEISRIFCDEISEWEKNLETAAKFQMFPE